MALPKEVYYKIVLDISYELVEEEPEDIKYLSRAFLPPEELKDIKNFRDLASKLEDNKVFSEDNLQELERLLSEIKRFDLVQMVKETKAKHVSAQGQHGGAFHNDASNLAGKTTGRLESDLETDDSSPMETDGAGATLGDLKHYCHPPEKDSIVFFPQKNSQSEELNREQSKLISCLKTEFSRNPLTKGIIVTRSDQDTKILFCAIESSKELCNRKFMVRPKKILNYFIHETLTKFNKGPERCNLLIATDAVVKDKIELCECGFLFRYNLVKKEMGTIQALARSQKSCSKCYLLIDKESQEHDQEIEN
ncbi:uncharacterized protein LOC117118208, partial [Anneissia japonica]|uniref:uncharacterized protein LOC117118208 n=1 Tax=Anneissia japonica TaxID=1529436 RepID=UPI0014256871